MRRPKNSIEFETVAEHEMNSNGGLAATCSLIQKEVTQSLMCVRFSKYTFTAFITHLLMSLFTNYPDHHSEGPERPSLGVKI